MYYRPSKTRTSESTVFADEVAQALGGDPEAQTHVMLSASRGKSLRLIDVLPLRFGPGKNAKRERIAEAVRSGRAGRNATSGSIERHLNERARMPGAFETMVTKRRRDRAAEARTRGDAAFAKAVSERALWHTAIASCGGIIPNETMVDGRAIRDPAFEAVPRRFLSTLRPTWIAGASAHQGNISEIIASLTAVGIAQGADAVLAWCSADAAPSRLTQRRLAKAEVHAECEAEVRELLRSRLIPIVKPTKTQQKIDFQNRKRKAAIKRHSRETKIDMSAD